MDTRFTAFILTALPRRKARHLHTLAGSLFLIGCVLVALCMASAAAASEAKSKQPEIAKPDLVRGMMALRAGEFATAYTILQPIAVSRSVHAQYAVGLILAKQGQQLPADTFDSHSIRAITDLAERDARRKAVRETQAHQMFVAAARQGHIGAVFELGFQFERGIGTSADIDKALQMYRIAAAKNHLNAQYNLAVLLSAGKDGKPDFAKAYLWAIAAQNNAIKTMHPVLTPQMMNSLARRIRSKIRHGDAVRARRAVASLTGLGV